MYEFIPYLELRSTDEASILAFGSKTEINNDIVFSKTMSLLFFVGDLKDLLTNHIISCHLSSVTNLHQKHNMSLKIFEKKYSRPNLDLLKPPPFMDGTFDEKLMT